MPKRSQERPVISAYGHSYDVVSKPQLNLVSSSSHEIQVSEIIPENGLHKPTIAAYGQSELSFKYYLLNTENLSFYL